MLGASAAATTFVGFLIQWYTLTHVGPGPQTDALFAGLTVPQFIVVVASNPLAHVLVPLLATGDRSAREGGAWAVFLLSLMGFAVLAAILAASASLWLPLLVPGFSDSAKQLTVRLGRIQMGGMAFMATAAVLRSAFHARNEFIWAAFSAFLASVAGLAALVLMLPAYGVDAAAWSFTLRSALEFILLVPALGPFRRPAWHSPLVGATWRRIRPLVLGYSYERTEIVLDRLLASLAPAGALSLLYLGQQVYGAVGQVINRAVTLPVTPRLAQEAARGDWPAFQATYRRRLGWIAGVTLAAFLVVLLAGRPVLSLVFGMRNVTSEDVALLWLLMVLLAGLLHGDPTGHLLLTGFYAVGDTRTPTGIGMAMYTVGVAVKLLGTALGGIAGLAVATSAYYFGRSAVLYVGLRRKVQVQVRQTG
ncbi:MAG TPA: lipid II flippase MurJ [Methylomirabilota bacterium]|nr:lipid II flippase MurJ [Methylomirabilota bacterium]